VLIRGGLRFWRPSKPKVRLAEFKSRHVSAGRILWRPNIWNRTLLVPLDVGFTTTQLRSGARDLNPEPSRSRTESASCPRGSHRVRRCPPEPKLPCLGVRPCRPRSAWCRESVPRLCPRVCLNDGGPATTLH
jgi:hypothetical protein